MTDTATIRGGRPPGNATSYNPICGQDCPPGTPVCQSADDDGTVLMADASDADTAYVTGLTSGRGVEGNPVLVQFGGILTLTEAEWDAITGGSGGLDRNTPYFLSTTAGRLTTTAPSGGGDFVVPIGTATSSTDLMVRPGFPAEA